MYAEWKRELGGIRHYESKGTIRIPISKISRKLNIKNA
jgi:hypothetical protein